MAWSPYSLIFFRFVQGLGVGAIAPTALAVIFQVFPPQQRGLAMGIYSLGWTFGPMWPDFHLAGEAKLQYLRHGRFFVLLSSHGGHEFLRREGAAVRDARRTPIKFAGYSVSFRRGHACVRIEVETYKWLKTRFVEQALQGKEKLEVGFYQLPFEPYRPVRHQLLTMLRAVNRRRKAAGYELPPVSCVRFKRKIYRPFEREGERTSTLNEAA